MGHWGTYPPSVNFKPFNFSGHLGAAQTLTLDSIWLPVQKKYTDLYLCHCLWHEFRNIFCASPLYLSFVPVHAPNPGDATVARSPLNCNF